MGWAGVSEGLKHWDTKAIGGAINQVYANHVEDKAKEAAKKKYDDQVAALQKEYAAGQEAQKAANSTPQPRALPTQADGPVTADTGVDAVSAPQQAAIKPMSKGEYEAKLREAENTYKNDQSQARIDYYRARGMDAERIKAEDELKNTKFHQGMVKKYYDVLGGDPTATKELVNYMNASMGGGNQITMNDDGTMSLLQNGKVVQANFTPSRQQINDAFGSMYNMAKFVNDGNFDSMLDRTSKMQSMALAERGDKRADKRLDLDTLIADRNFQARLKEIGLDEQRLRQTFELFQQEQDRLDARQLRDIDAADRRQAVGIAAEDARAERSQQFTASENEKDRTFRAGEAANDRSWRSDESEKDRTFRADESEKDRSFRSDEAATQREWQSGENTADRTFRASESERDRTFRAGESERDRAFRAGESERDRTFRASESEKDRAHTSREADRDRTFRASEAATQREWQSGENREDRTFRAVEAERDRGFQAGEAERDRTFRAGEAERDRQFRSSEASAQRTWQSGENATDRRFRTSEAEAQRSWQTGENAADRTFRASEAERDRTFQSSEASAQRRWAAGESALDRKSREDIADRGYAIDDRRVALEEQKYQDEREAVARDIAEKMKGVWEQDETSGDYVLRGKDGRVYAYQTKDGPVIPAGMDEEQYASFMEEATDRGLTPTLIAPEGEPLMLVVELPDGSVSDNLEEAEEIWKEYERSQSAIPPKGGRR